MKDKTPIYYSSRFWAYLYAVVLFILLTLQFVLGLLSNSNFTLPVIIQKYANGSLELPMEIATWIWTALVSMFCGFDRFVDIKNTTHLSSGQMNLGDLGKLRSIIVISLLLFLYALVCSFLVNKDFQLPALLSAFGSTVIIYISGNKLVKANKYKCEDKDKDGIPDLVQKEYYKWVRQQKKDGVEEAFITFEYFLDANPELESFLKEHTN